MEMEKDPKEDIGLIAQEVESMCPGGAGSPGGIQGRGLFKTHRVPGGSHQGIGPLAV